MSKSPSRSKKGQVAMEFLMNYGLAFLVVFVTIGALWYFGVLDAGNFSSKHRCGCHSEDMVTTEVFKLNGTYVYECSKIEKTINYNDRTIDFTKVSDLYICINNTMVIV